jgi:hypothetical protein
MAASREQELSCPGQQVSVLIDLDDVTGKVTAATRALDDAEANEARKAALTDLETECEEAVRSGVPLQWRPVLHIQVQAIRRRSARICP